MKIPAVLEDYDGVRIKKRQIANCREQRMFCAF
jgi:hypothetical protein